MLVCGGGYVCGGQRMTLGAVLWDTIRLLGYKVALGIELTN